ncbi:hypothetical protein, partial [Flavobacterium psychrophilum]|uniref:hypothetical protein n=1 Tax=Flavobacterium psychrophilum TaxID=96345 RepID=UPI001ABCEA4F
KNIQFVIPRNEESHQVIQIMRFLVPRNDNILNKYSSIFKAKLVLIRVIRGSNSKIVCSGLSK